MISAEESRKFLDPVTIAALANFQLSARLIVEGFFNGLHHGPRPGFSLEYDRHRDYGPGDPLKLIDWKLYGKTDKFFVRQYEEETNLEAWLLLDISGSMAYTGKQTSVSKLQYASYLSAALAHLLIRQKDRAGLIFFDDQIRKLIPPSSSNRQLNLILSELKNTRSGGQSNFEETTRSVASRIKKRGLTILFSDLLGDPEQIEKHFKQFLARGSELIVFHILTREELRFPFRKFGFFKDMESEKKILLQPALFKEEYLKQVDVYLKALQQACLKLHVSYLMLETTTPFDRGLQTFMSARTRMQ